VLESFLVLVSEIKIKVKPPDDVLAKAGMANIWNFKHGMVGYLV